MPLLQNPSLNLPSVRTLNPALNPATLSTLAPSTLNLLDTAGVTAPQGLLRQPALGSLSSLLPSTTPTASAPAPLTPASPGGGRRASGYSQAYDPDGRGFVDMGTPIDKLRAATAARKASKKKGANATPSNL